MPVLPVTLPLRPPLHKLLQWPGATSGAATTAEAVEAVITEAVEVAAAPIITTKIKLSQTPPPIQNHIKRDPNTTQMFPTMRAPVTGPKGKMQNIVVTL